MIFLDNLVLSESEVSVKFVSKKRNPELSDAELEELLKNVLMVSQIFKETVQVFPGKRIGHRFHLLRRLVLICTQGNLVLYRQKDGGRVASIFLSADKAEGNHFCYAVVDPETAYLVSNKTKSVAQLVIWSDRPNDRNDEYESRIVL